MKKLIFTIFTVLSIAGFSYEKYFMIENQHSYNNYIKLGLGIRERYNNFGLDNFVKFGTDVFERTKGIESKGLYYFNDYYATCGFEFDIFKFNCNCFPSSKKFYRFGALLGLGYETMDHFIELNYFPLRKTIHLRGNDFETFSLKFGIKL